MRVLMSGGGTGGHVNPAIAIANEIAKREPDSEIAFVGTKRGIESRLVPKEGYELHFIEIQGIRRSLSLDNLKTAYLAAKSFAECKKIIKRFKPDLVVGTGGYACWPVVRAAAALKIPTALHESNAVPGFAVKMLEKKADKVFVNFEETISKLALPEKAKRVGNPLKRGFTEIDRDEAREELGITGKYRTFLLSLGGSMGAERVNKEVLEVMKEYTSKHPEILHVHATGAIEYEETKAAFERAGLDRCENIVLLEYVYDMPVRMAAADVVINRAGAMTLSELALLGKAAILIPSPNVTNNHQYKNAAVLADAGAAVLVEEKELTPGVLTSTVKELCENRELRASMQENIKKFAVGDAAGLIYEDLRKLVKN
ncbi:MAG: undecaprenyldiphospho-muramoylpentapeptide beta-N-acetylglucosaminyltransferase [Clostridia bacterium]|nr:undecaprenyldiphospho-muramoylpentapeptide beta-N-acetylglucosaminyltransferase [Clostridia bacterium]